MLKQAQGVLSARRAPRIWEYRPQSQFLELTARSAPCRYQRFLCTASRLVIRLALALTGQHVTISRVPIAVQYGTTVSL